MKTGNIKTEAQYAKANFYYSDGTGRDTYVQFDNGGLTLHAQRCHQPPVGSFQPKNQRKFIDLNQAIRLCIILAMEVEEIIIFCKQDSHGGLMNTCADRHWLVSFKQGLRTPERERPRSGAKTPQYSYQQRICRRLSVPKYTKIPFEKQLQSEDII